MTIVFYAMNGVGVGHVVRTATLAEALRSEWRTFDEAIQMFAITTSEAPDMFLDKCMPFFKLPSPVVMTVAGISRSDYDVLGRTITYEVLRKLRPDLLVVDTLPSGLFGELVPPYSEGVLGCCRRRALIARPVLHAIAERPTYGPALEQYDLIIVPEHSQDTFALSERLAERVRFCGPIISLGQQSSIDDPPRRLRANIEANKLLVLLSVGGGGHPDAQAIIEFVLESLATERNIHIVVTAGPLYRGRVHGPLQNVTWLKGERTVALLNDVDIAISTAGYNSFNELMFNRIPTVFIPVAAKLDDQTARAERGRREGAAQVLSSLDPARLRKFIDEWRDPILRSRAANATKRVVPANGAIAAARELLSLLNNSSPHPG